MSRTLRARLAPTLATAVLASATLGCGASDSTAPVLPPCDEGTQITELPTASGGRVSWSPACAVSFVAAVDSASNVAIWAIRTNTPALASPQQAYETPAGAYELAGRRRLQEGTPYYMILGVRYTDPATGHIGERSVALRYFRP